MGKATDDSTAGMGLVIDGAVVPGGAGTYPVTNPARPAEVVFDAPAASATQLDQAVGAARRAFPGWAARRPEHRAPRR
jgi:acyl-CoA reductase-like NAD-dependent aldehyde dehydrogenase